MPSPQAYIPSAAAKETKGTRMILSAILFQIHSMLAIGISHQREVATTNIKNLPPDAVVNLVAQNLSESLAYVCFAPITTKPEEPVNGTSKTVPGNDVQLVLGHLAEHLAEALGFGGVGVDRKCRGAVLTLTSIEIMELELTNVGTSDAKLQLKRSGAYPLFDEKTTRCLLGVNNKDGAARMNPRLVDSDPSKGFAILVSLASNKGIESARSAEKIVYVNTCKETAKEHELVRHLGAGAYNNVYKLSAPRSYLKVPMRCSIVDSLQNELQMLKALDHVGIPKAAETLGFLKVAVRCETSELRCLRLNGLVGTPASTFYFFDLATITLVCEKVMDALDHAHSREIVHLDVCPSNIIVLQEMDGSIQVQLVDWGCASSTRTRLTSFRGKRFFAHEDLLGLEDGESWTPAAEHDLASLVYTMADIIIKSQSFLEGRDSEQYSESGSLESNDLEPSSKRPRRELLMYLDDDDDKPHLFENIRIMAEKDLAKLTLLDSSRRTKLVTSLKSLKRNSKSNCN